MAYKTILTILTDPSQLPQLDAAQAVAEHQDGHLDVLCLGIDFSQPGYYYPGESPYMFQTAMDQAVTDAETLKQGIEQRLKNSPGLRFSVTAAVTQSSSVTNLVGTRARYADLTVLGQPYTDDKSGSSESVTEAAMFEGGCPVLVLPEGGLPDAGFKRVLVAWNQSTEAMTAVRRALPLLRRADLVELTIIDPTRSIEPSEPGAALAQLLTRHGVNTQITVIARTAATVSEEILRRATEMDADLIVMGAYGHSRFREAILGGATRSMLEKSNLPVFMAR